jgi:hypothetical protein
MAAQTSAWGISKAGVNLTYNPMAVWLQGWGFKRWMKA